MPDDPHNLQRFIEAQARDYATALAEIRRGRKETHWIWYVFPQLRGLGQSETAKFYGISSLDEARAYLAHPILGPRLTECTKALQPLNERTIQSAFGSLDAMKLCSSLTLFIEAGGGALYSDALARLFGGEADTKTLKLLSS